MRRITALLLSLVLLVCSLFPLTACNGDNPGAGNEPPTGSSGIGDGSQADETLDSEGIRVPEYKDYQRGTVSFEDMKYERPDIDGAIKVIEGITEIIAKNTLAYEEILEKLSELNPLYSNVRTMSSLTEIYTRKNTEDSYWQEEKLYISSNYPKFTKAMEALYTAAANSPIAEALAEGFFGEELWDYIDGGIYTEKLVELMEKEAEYEGEYNAISTKTVQISYEGITGTYDEIVSFYRNEYGEGSLLHLRAEAECKRLYNEAASARGSELLVKLIKQRRLIADELGYRSYRDFAYETIYHDYDSKKFDGFIKDIKDYIIPVYLNLSRYIFTPYIEEYESGDEKLKTEKAELINTLYGVYEGAGAEFSEIYSYMLQHKLYDIDKIKEGRYDGAFTVYIKGYRAPYLFASLTGNALDYTTVAHEFGHFADSYINNGKKSSLDLSEVYSQGMELLTLTELEDELDENTGKYLTYLKLEELFGTMIFQSFYASFEAAAYELPYEAITKKSLDAIVSKTAKSMGLSSSWNSIEYVLIPHIVLYPFYVQSYATSAAVAAEIYCLELKTDGAGFTAYSALINADDTMTFEESIAAAGLTSPFSEKRLMWLADGIYYLVMGAHYFTDSESNVA